MRFSRFSYHVTQSNENIQNIAGSFLGCINLGNIIKDINTNMNILNYIMSQIGYFRDFYKMMSMICLKKKMTTKTKKVINTM